MSKVARKARTALFEEFLQAGEDWAESTIVLSARRESSTMKRGKYRLMSRDESWMNLLTFMTLLDYCMGESVH